MKKILVTAALLFTFMTCGQGQFTEMPAPTAGQERFTEAPAPTEELPQEPSPSSESTEEVEEMRMKITVNGTELTAVLEDNATSRAIWEQLPMTLPMMDLYGREMCYRYGANALPTEELRYDGYEVGDLTYWPPAGSFVILYKQNGEQFERQHLGHIESGVEIFEDTGDVDVTFERLK